MDLVNTVPVMLKDHLKQIVFSHYFPFYTYAHILLSSFINNRGINPIRLVKNTFVQ